MNTYKTEPKENNKFETVELNKEKFIGLLNEIDLLKDLDNLRGRMKEVKEIIISDRDDCYGIFSFNNTERLSYCRDILISEIEQILEAKSYERSFYYLKRLIKGAREIKTGEINDINLLRWKEYEEILTDSLWLINKRDSAGAHIASYWGNFIPQIPRQLMLRYTKKGDWILDTFSGSGTTLIECRRMGRNGIGIELNHRVAEEAKKLIEKEENRDKVITKIIVGDNRTADIKQALMEENISRVQLLIMHPPYYDIIKFSEDERDLSNAESVDNFLQMFGQSIDNADPFLERGRYFAVVTGDKYSKGEWIPLGFYCMNEVLKRDYLLKSIIVKNFEETKGKRHTREVWRYRAIAGGFYIFKHEYIFLFQKK